MPDVGISLNEREVWWPTKTLAKRYASGASADSSASGASPEADEAVVWWPKRALSESSVSSASVAVKSASADSVRASGASPEAEIRRFDRIGH